MAADEANNLTAAGNTPRGGLWLAAGTLRQGEARMDAIRGGSGSTAPLLGWAEVKIPSPWGRMGESKARPRGPNGWITGLACQGHLASASHGTVCIDSLNSITDLTVWRCQPRSSDAIGTLHGLRGVVCSDRQRPVAEKPWKKRRGPHELVS